MVLPSVDRVESRIPAIVYGLRFLVDILLFVLNSIVMQHRILLLKPQRVETIEEANFCYSLRN